MWLHSGDGSGSELDLQSLLSAGIQQTEQVEDLAVVADLDSELTSLRDA